MFNAYVNCETIHSMYMCSHVSVGLISDIFLENSSLYALRQPMSLPSQESPILHSLAAQLLWGSSASGSQGLS